MKKQILLLYDNRELDRQVLKPVDYSAFEHDWIVQNGGNSGNKLYNTAVEQYLTKEDIEYSYYTGEESVEMINEKYDLAIFTTANIFNANPVITKQLDEFASMIEKFKIPVYILGCGLQCDSYDNISALAEQIKEPTIRFLRAIYQTGGELALRGYATKEFLDKVMPNTAVVTGCPSFYQKGSKLEISNEKVTEDKFRLALNGNLKYLKKIGLLQAFVQYPNSVYMDQDEFAQMLYFQSTSKDDMIPELIRKKTGVAPGLLAQDRVQLIYDIPVWMDYFKQQKISFSCGSRIHGNIVASLAQVPAMVFYRDARTRELAEFFELPNAAAIEYDRTTSVYEKYLKADYSAFNAHFQDKFKTFEKFMLQHGISHDLDDRCLFEANRQKYQWEMPEIIGKSKIEKMKKQWKKHEKFYCHYDKILDNMRNIVSKSNS